MIEVKDLGKIYYTKNGEFDALRNFNLKFEPGEFISILGESGSGKSTFLNLLSGVDNYTNGEIIIDDESTLEFTDLDWRRIRNQKIGFIFQRFNLIEHLSVIENVTLPLVLTGADKASAEKMAVQLLKEVGLGDIIDKKVNVLSGGQKQRIAIARTMIINPTIILADEPTGALDSSSGKEVMNLLQKFAKDRIIILVTHDNKLAEENSTRIIRIFAGEVQSDIQNTPKFTAIETFESEKLVGVEQEVNTFNIDKLKKQYPQYMEGVNEGDTIYIPFDREYQKTGYKFTRMIAKKNYSQKKKTNFNILWSFVVSLTLLLAINLVLSNIIHYNVNVFDINNDYERYLISDYQEYQYGQAANEDDTSFGCNFNTLVSSDNAGYGDNACEIIRYLNTLDVVSEAGMYYTTYDISSIYHMETSISTPNEMSLVSTENSFTPRLVTLPTYEENFYLKDEIYVGNYPDNLNDFSGISFNTERQVLVSSEFILSRFYGLSLSNEVNNQNNLTFSDLNISISNDIIGSKIFLCAESYDSEPTIESELVGSTKDQKCVDYIISGVIDSYYSGINYSGDIFVTENGFRRYLDKVKFMGQNLGNPDATGYGYYTENVYYFYKNFNNGNNVMLGDENNFGIQYGINTKTSVTTASVSNPYLYDYEQIALLLLVTDFVFIMIYVALIVICGTVNVSIVTSSVLGRTREIGVYSSIGVSKSNIRNIFMFETVRLATRIIIYVVILNVILVALLYLFYNGLVTHLPDLNTAFGISSDIQPQITFSIVVMTFTLVFLFVSVLVPSFKAANMRAIDALRG